MRILESFLRFIKPTRTIETTPELMAGAINLMVLKHFDLLLDFIKEMRIPWTEPQATRTFSELFCFYYSLASVELTSRLSSDEEFNLYGASLLAEARRLFTQMDNPASIRVWFEDDSLFSPYFDSSFRFYYHDKISENDQMPFERVASLCNATISNPSLYMAAKLQFKTATILELSPMHSEFIPLWIRQSTTITSFARTLSEINPVLP